jgi:catechol 2,3-dioxygenase-like lactoylglutathione lyase family enzyme
MIKGITFASVPVVNQDRALEFYTKKLGLRIITDAPFSDDQRWIGSASRGLRRSSCSSRQKSTRR